MVQKIIVVEGIDGVGKSTFCKLLAEGLGITNIALAKTPYGESHALAIMAKAEGSIASFCGYLIGDICIAKQFENYEFLILDRYILSTLVYHNQVVENLSESIFQILESINMAKPIITVLLEADLPIVENRLRLRKEQTKSNRSYIELQRQFEKYIHDPKVQPWLGRVVKLPSESFEDHQKGLELISKILVNH